MTRTTTTSFRFALLDPRQIPPAAAANDAIFASGAVFGVEVTVPALAARCIGNLDPQHSGGDSTLAAIQAALEVELPPVGATLATVRPDVDSIGTMAVFAIRARGESLEPAMERIALVATADSFARGGWQPGVLPTVDNRWPGGGAADATQELSAVNAAVQDFKAPIGDRVAIMERWLLTGEEPQQYRLQVERERDSMIAALSSGEISVETTPDGRIAVVTSTHRAATAVGYAKAPVVVASNPAFVVGGGQPHLKHSVCQYTPGYADLIGAVAELKGREPGWGGSPTFIGSGQGVGSLYTTAEVVGVVARHLK